MDRFCRKFIFVLCKLSEVREVTLINSLILFTEKLSQEPTPSKWSSLLPDFSSQADGDAGEVHWDCASPDVVKHLKSESLSVLQSLVTQ